MERIPEWGLCRLAKGDSVLTARASFPSHADQYSVPRGLADAVVAFLATGTLQTVLLQPNHRGSGSPNKMDTGSEGYRMSEDELREILQAIADLQRHTSATLANLIELLFDPEFGSILKCDQAQFTKRLADMTQGVIAD